MCSSTGTQLRSPTTAQNWGLGEGWEVVVIKTCLRLHVCSFMCALPVVSGVCAVCLYYHLPLSLPFPLPLLLPLLLPLPLPLADVDECTEGTLERHQLSRGEQLHQGHMHTFIHQTVSIATRIRQLLKDVCRINDKSRNGLMLISPVGCSTGKWGRSLGTLDTSWKELSLHSYL